MNESLSLRDCLEITWTTLRRRFLASWRRKDQRNSQSYLAGFATISWLKRSSKIVQVISRQSLNPTHRYLPSLRIDDFATKSHEISGFSEKHSFILTFLVLSFSFIVVTSCSTSPTSSEGIDARKAKGESVTESKDGGKSNGVKNSDSLDEPQKAQVDSADRNSDGLNKDKEIDSEFSKATESSSGKTSKSSSGANPAQLEALAQAEKNSDYDKILKVSTQILSQNPDDTNALNGLALFHLKYNRTEAAHYFIKKALIANSNSSESYANLGLVWLAKGDQRKAVAQFRKALQINNANKIAAANLGTIYAKAKDYNQAAVSYSIAYEHGIRTAGLLNNYGVSLMATGQFEKAKEIFKAGLALNSNSVNREILFNYSILLVEHLKNYQEGMDIISKLNLLGPPSGSRNKLITLENKVKSGLK